LKPITLKETLESSLEAILSLPYFSMLNKGSILMVEDSGDTLRLEAHRGLPQSMQIQRTSIPFGRCLCGRAASTRNTLYFDHVAAEHEDRSDGISPHGHYCVPILLGERALGVINAYVPADHERVKEEEQFLVMVANTLAGIIDRKQTESKVLHMAYHDSLTGLPNRALLQDRLDQAIGLAQRQNVLIGVLYIDLDHFKLINDTLGHTTGDEILKAVAERPTRSPTIRIAAGRCCGATMATRGDAIMPNAWPASRCTVAPTPTARKETTKAAVESSSPGITRT